MSFSEPASSLLPATAAGLAPGRGERRGAGGTVTGDTARPPTAAGSISGERPGTKAACG